MKFGEVIEKAGAGKYRAAAQDGQLGLFGGVEGNSTTGKQQHLNDATPTPPQTPPPAPTPSPPVERKKQAEQKMIQATRAAGSRKPPSGYRPAPHSKKGGWTDGKGNYWYAGGSKSGNEQDKAEAESLHKREKAHQTAAEVHEEQANDLSLPSSLRNAHTLAALKHHGALADIGNVDKGKAALDVSEATHAAVRAHNDEKRDEHMRLSAEHDAKAASAGSMEEKKAHQTASAEHHGAAQLYQHPGRVAYKDGHKPFVEASERAHKQSALANQRSVNPYESKSDDEVRMALEKHNAYMNGLPHPADFQNQSEQDAARAKIDEAHAEASRINAEVNRRAAPGGRSDWLARREWFDGANANAHRKMTARPADDTMEQAAQPGTQAHYDQQRAAHHARGDAALAKLRTVYASPAGASLDPAVLKRAEHLASKEQRGYMTAVEARDAADKLESMAETAAEEHRDWEAWRKNSIPTHEPVKPEPGSAKLGADGSWHPHIARAWHHATDGFGNRLATGSIRSIAQGMGGGGDGSRVADLIEPYLHDYAAHVASQYTKSPKPAPDPAEMNLTPAQAKEAVSRFHAVVGDPGLPTETVTANVGLPEHNLGDKFTSAMRDFMAPGRDEPLHGHSRMRSAYNAVEGVKRTVQQFDPTGRSGKTVPIPDTRQQHARLHATALNHAHGETHVFEVVPPTPGSSGGHTVKAHKRGSTGAIRALTGPAESTPGALR